MPLMTRHVVRSKYYLVKDEGRWTSSLGILKAGGGGPSLSSGLVIEQLLLLTSAVDPFGLALYSNLHQTLIMHSGYVIY